MYYKMTEIAMVTCSCNQKWRVKVKNLKLVLISGQQPNKFKPLFRASNKNKVLFNNAFNEVLCHPKHLSYSNENVYNI